MTFADVDKRYQNLKQQFKSGLLSETEFDEALKELMIQDDQGRWWAKARDTGQWNYYDAVTQNWTPASPPVQTPQPPPAYAPRAMEQTPAEPVYTERGVYQPQTAQPSAQTFSAASFRTDQPELSPGIKVVFYILSFLVPIVGIVLYFVYRGKPAQEDRSAANLFLILGLISFALSCLCSFIIPFMLAPFAY
jgi:hypothetical protein